MRTSIFASSIVAVLTLVSCSDPADSPADGPAGTSTSALTQTVHEEGTVARYQWSHFGPYQAQSGTFRAVMTGTGDADLYVRKGARPTTSAYTCRPYLDGSNETCTLSLTGPTDVYPILTTPSRTH